MPDASADLAVLNHQLRTPLNAVLGFSQMLLGDDAQPLTDAQREMVEHIRNGGEELLQLLDTWADRHLGG